MVYQESKIMVVIEHVGDRLFRKIWSIQPPNSKYKDYVFYEESCCVGACCAFPRVYPKYVPTRADLRRIRFEETGNPDDLHDNSFEREEHLAIMGG